MKIYVNNDSRSYGRRLCEALLPQSILPLQVPLPLPLARPIYTDTRDISVGIFGQTLSMPPLCHRVHRINLNLTLLTLTLFER